MEAVSSLVGSGICSITYRSIIIYGYQNCEQQICICGPNHWTSWPQRAVYPSRPISDVFVVKLLFNCLDARGMMRDRKAFYSWALVGAYSAVMSAVQRFQLSALAAFWSNEGGCNSNMTTSIGMFTRDAHCQASAPTSYRDQPWYKNCRRPSRRNLKTPQKHIGMA